MKKRGMESRKQRLHHRQRSRKVRDNVERSFVPQKRVASPDRSKRREALGGSIQLKKGRVIRFHDVLVHGERSFMILLEKLKLT